ncbi:sulfite exporter TauE/SafE family protein [Elongatibacter sediminis]|uniref:Probable membrane transporter protein n=1 Tax=Elongatibacter sediminis TaxID=3119006 RepID=A0AAW9RJ77_9GAMM
MNELFLLALAMLGTGLVGGLMAGVLGVGGGVVIVPMLEFALGVIGVDASIRMHIAVATSLATIIPTSIASSRAHYRRGGVDLVIARRWAPWILLGSLAGTWVASQVDSRVLAILFACLAVLVAMRMMLNIRTRPLTQSVPTSPALAPVPALIGFVSAMIGIGGGSLTVPTMSLMGEPIHRAVGTAALFGLVIAVPGTLGFMATGYGNPLLPAGSIGFVNGLGFALIAPTTVFAAPFGARLAHAMNQRQLSLIFGVFLLLVSVRMLVRALA